MHNKKVIYKLLSFIIVFTLMITITIPSGAFSYDASEDINENSKTKVEEVKTGEDVSEQKEKNEESAEQTDSDSTENKKNDENSSLETSKDKDEGSSQSPEEKPEKSSEKKVEGIDKAAEQKKVENIGKPKKEKKESLKNEDLKKQLKDSKSVLQNIPVKQKNNVSYVSDSGSDSTGDGSREKPYKTIEYAAPRTEKVVLLSDIKQKSLVSVWENLKVESDKGHVYTITRQPGFNIAYDPARQNYNPAMFELHPDRGDRTLTFENVILDDNNLKEAAVDAFQSTDGSGKTTVGGVEYLNTQLCHEATVVAHEIVGKKATIILGGGTVLKNHGGKTAVRVCGDTEVVMKNGSKITGSGKNYGAGTAAIWADSGSITMEEGSEVKDVVGGIGIIAFFSSKVYIGGIISDITHQTPFKLYRSKCTIGKTGVMKKCRDIYGYIYSTGGDEIQLEGKLEGRKPAFIGNIGIYTSDNVGRSKLHIKESAEVTNFNVGVQTNISSEIKMDGGEFHNNIIGINVRKGSTFTRNGGKFRKNNSAIVLAKKGTSKAKVFENDTDESMVDNISDYYIERTEAGHLNGSYMHFSPKSISKEPKVTMEIDSKKIHLKKGCGEVLLGNATANAKNLLTTKVNEYQEGKILTTWFAKTQSGLHFKMEGIAKNNSPIFLMAYPLEENGNGLPSGEPKVYGVRKTFEGDKMILEAKAPEVSENGFAYALFTNKSTVSISSALLNKKIVTKAGVTEFPEQSFEFTLKGMDAASKAVLGNVTFTEVKNYSSPTASEGEDIDFGEITFLKEGKYDFEVKEEELSDEQKKSWTQEKTSKIISVNVEKAVDGKLNITSVTPKLEVTNIYAAPIKLITDDVDHGIAVQKKIKGEKPVQVDAVFEFVMSGIDAAPMPTGEENKVNIPIVNGNLQNDGKAKFGNIKYNKTGVYNYEVSETAIADNVHFETDKKKYRVSVIIEKTADKKSLKVKSVTYSDVETGSEANACNFINLYKTEESDEFSIQINKSISKKPIFTPNPKSFTFKIEALDDATKAFMPANSEITTEPTNTVAQKSFEAIKYNKSGTYQYKVTEVKGSDKGWNYSDEEYKVKVTVKDKGGKYIVESPEITDRAGENVDAIKFKNNYHPNKTEHNAMGNITLRKVIKGGKPNKSDVFKFNLKPRNINNPMPKGTKKGIKSLTIKDEGSTNLGSWQYSEPGIYEYDLTEVDLKNSDYVYDKSLYNIADEVKDNGEGQLVLKRTVMKDGKEIEECVFNNEYVGVLSTERTPSTDIRHDNNHNSIKQDHNSNPKTGDSSNSIVWITALMFSIISAIALFLRKAKTNI